jgi:hypothetical protein
MPGSRFTQLGDGSIARNVFVLGTGGVEVAGITQAQLDAAITATRAACGPSSAVFSTSLSFTGSPIVYSQHIITAPLNFTTASAPVEGASVILRLTASGDQANVPTFPGSQLVGSAGWVNVQGTINIVSLHYLGSTVFYSINQPVPVVVVSPPIDPVVETFVNFARRTPDLLLNGTTYSTTGAAGHFVTYATSDVRLTGDGYYVMGAASTNSALIGLSTSSTLQSHGAWIYRLTRYGPTGGCVFNYGGAVRGDFPTGVTDEIRFFRSGATISIQSKSAAATTWTIRYTYPETFSGNLWLNFSLSSDGGSTSSSFANPRSLGAS